MDRELTIEAAVAFREVAWFAAILAGGFAATGVIMAGLSSCVVMPASSTRFRTMVYSPLQIRLHWWVALLMLVQFVFHDGMVAAMRAIEQGETPTAAQFLLSNLHLLCGVMILALALWRLWLRYQRRGVALAAPADQVPGWQQRLAAVVHIWLYGLLIAMPLSGVMAYYQWWSFAATLHQSGKVALLLTLLLHVLAALYHHWIRRDGVLRRMLPGSQN